MKTFNSILLLAGAADAFWRMECHSRIGLARIDPLVEPGDVSDHAHVIHGGQNFKMTTTAADLMQSKCTSCRVLQDNSVYWTPSLHFMYANGTTEIVPQIGGMLAYYLLFGQNITAFPQGFRLLAGDVRQRNFTLPVPDPPKSEWTGEAVSQKSLSQKAIGFNCLDYAKGTNEATLYRHFLPDKAYLDANCKSGLRLELAFPSCWNGKDLDSTNHKSHMAYTDLVLDGTCPKGFETRVPTLMYETIWNTYKYAGEAGQFVLASGDPTGYGYHGDFISGWEENFLQQAIETCTNPSGKIEDCALFKLQTEAEAAQCEMTMPKELKDDNCAGPAPGLCGNVPIQYGPAYASPLGGGANNPPAPSSTSLTQSAVVPTLSFSQGTYAFTDSHGGGVTVARLANAEGATPVAAAAPSSSQASSPVPAAFQETPKPNPASAAAGKPNERIVSTSVFTSAGAVYEVVIVEEDVTVTAAQAARKRHLHHHRRNGHGL